MESNAIETNTSIVDKTAEEILKLQELSKQVEIKLKQKREELLEVMRKTKTLTLKTESYTISRAKRVTTRVISEQEIEQELSKRNIPIDYEKKLSAQTIKVVKDLVKQGVEVPGTTNLETEYLSIRSTLQNK